MSLFVCRWGLVLSSKALAFFFASTLLVLQDDLLYANLSAEELLYYAAMLSMPKNMTQ